MSAPLLLHVFPGFEIGGAQTRFASVANHFGSKYRHVIIAMNGVTQARERLDPALDVEFQAVEVIEGRTLANLRPFHRILRAIRPNVLITHNWGSIDWALANHAARIPHIHIEDGFGPEERDQRLRRRSVIRKFALRGRTVVVPSRTLERIALGDWGLAPKRVCYIPNGIDLARFGVPPSSEIYNDGGLVIGTVATLRPVKALDRLLRAFARLPNDPLLVIVGDGPERCRLQKLAFESGISPRVRFAGHLAEPAPYIRAFDIFALSSDTEQMPLSVMEAMAAGLPVASTNVGDVACMVTPDNAPYVIAEADDDRLLTISMRALMENAALRKKLGAANREKASREFDQQAMFAAYGALFDACAARSSRQARRE